MELFWYIALTFMLTMYVILDGFDLGAGAIHLLAGKTDDARRQILRSIGPFWDGNEVWLVAFGGTLYFAFPRIYAASFSGFYLPLMLVLWLLIFRALSIEFRSHLQNSMWQGFWDFAFSLSSLLLIFFLGVALGNIVRGVPLDATGHFFVPLWTNFMVGTHAGALDWFTVLFGAVAVATLSAHGSLYVAMKTEGELRKHALRLAGRSWWGNVACSTAALAATTAIRPGFWQNFVQVPAGVLLLMIGAAALVAQFYFLRRKADRAAFLASSAFIAGAAGATAFAIFPNVLRATTEAANSLTVYNSASGEYALSVGMVWWGLGMLLACGYFTYLFYTFRGKVSGPDSSGHSANSL